MVIKEKKNSNPSQNKVQKQSGWWDKTNYIR